MRGRIYAIGGVELISSGAGAFGTAFRSRPAGTANLVREHEVLAVVGTVVAVQGASHPSPDELRRAVLDWALQKAGVQTKDNWHSGEEFEHIAGGRTLRVRRFCKDRAEAWALRAEHPDEVVPGRVWTTEVVIGVNGASPVELCLRLFVDAAQEPRDVEPAVPGCLRLLPGRLCVGPYHAESRPWYLSDKDDVRLLIDSLVDEERRLPIVALSETEETGRFGLDAIKLARALQGLAHVVAIPAPLTYVLTEEFGRRLSCYRGAARLFLPGFSPDSDPYAHRLILAERLASPNEASREQAWLRRECAALSLRRQRLRRDPLDFTTVRRLSLEQHADAMAFGADLAAQLASERERILGLSRDLEERIALEQEAIAENELLRERAEAAERDTRSAVARLQILLVARGTTAPQSDEAELPKAWRGFANWAESRLAGQLILSPRARKQVVNPKFENAELAARCLCWLAEDYRNGRLGGGSADLVNARVVEGVENARCGGDSFEMVWQGRRFQIEWHVKNGGNTRDPLRCLRIYYAWDEQLQQVLVAEMPAHRRTDAT